MLHLTPAMKDSLIERYRELQADVVDGVASNEDRAYFNHLRKMLNAIEEMEEE